MQDLVVSQIKDRANSDLFAVISNYVTLQQPRTGTEYKGVCPKCGSRHFSYSKSKGIYKCWNCNWGGTDAISFVMESQSVDFLTAIEQLGHLFCIDTSDDKTSILKIWDISQPDRREAALKAQKDHYSYLSKTVFPQLRYVDLEFHLHRKGMLKDTIHSNVVDTTYMKAVGYLRDYKYKEALDILNDYDDYNTALVLLCFKYNQRAIEILEKCSNTAGRNYLLAVAYIREGQEVKAVQALKRAILMDDILKFRADCEPELSRLMKKYNFDEDWR